MKIPVGSSTSYRGRNYRPNWLALAGFIALALAVGLSGERLASSSGTWYASLMKPAWTPPDRWLGSIWTILCIMTGAAGWLVWRERYHRMRNAAMLAYALQLALNAAWAPVFFSARNTGAGLFVMAALWTSLVWALREFAVVRPAAAWLLVPYLGWVSIAAALNLSIWRHN
jgi:tryptophan-rich sensory protein